MPTPAERKALLFLAGVIVLGASVRVVRAARDDGASDAASRQALARQIASVDSAHNDNRPRHSGRGSSRGLERRGPTKRSRRPADSSRVGDTAERRLGEPLREIGGLQARDTTAASLSVVDLDVASEMEIESLPRIGPVLARRIVQDRSAHGPFGSIEGFERVIGVGPALAAGLRARVTFSGTARPSNAVVDPRLRSSPTSSKSPRRERKN